MSDRKSVGVPAPLSNTLVQLLRWQVGAEEVTALSLMPTRPLPRKPSALPILWKEVLGKQPEPGRFCRV